jgi:photosystem II stability/assembly factor-like uncharacterized protein
MKLSYKPLLSALQQASLAVMFIVFLFVKMGVAQTPQPWAVIGPDGGDVRSIAAVPGDPTHLYIGTTNSWVYESKDGGVNWNRLSKIEPSDDLIIDRILVDAERKKTIYIGGWKLDGASGGLWISYDGGAKWNKASALEGQSVRSLTQSASDPARIYVGTLKGVYRSNDYGKNWAQISPVGSAEIHEVQSLAVDPKNPAIVYAGTWHLPWKTTDGGITWNSIKQGLIDDSDVFSIIIDPVNTNIVYTSACSGIYKSESAGDLYHKIQGIPATARRTRVLMQDPIDHDTVYAGTTEGLYKTIDGGANFKLMTASDVIVNGIYVSPIDHKKVMLATDRSGVLVSNDAGVTFQSSNGGFSQRKVEALLVSHAPVEGIFAGVANDKAYGGVFYSTDSGQHWTQISSGLNEHDVFSLAQAPDGTIFAGTTKGIFSLSAANITRNSVWKPAGLVKNTSSKSVVSVKNGKKTTKIQTVNLPAKNLESRVFALDFSGPVWLATTSDGVYTSKDKGASWQGQVLRVNDFRTAAVNGSTMAVANDIALALSTDSGSTWTTVNLPPTLSVLRRIAFSPNGVLWVGSRDGVYFFNSKDQSWMAFSRFPLRGIDDVYYDAGLNRVLFSSRTSDHVYAIDPDTKAWQLFMTGYRIHLIRAANDHLIAASLFDGVLMGAKVDSSVPASK